MYTPDNTSFPERQPQPFIHFVRTLRRILAIAVAPLALLAQATPTVPVQHPVYRDLDRVIGAGLVDVSLAGQRPFTRREIVRLIQEASQSPPRRPMSDAIRRVLDRLRVEFAQDLGSAQPEPAAPKRTHIYSRGLEFLTLESPARPIPTDATGSIDAEINPILNGRGGMRYQRSTNVAIEAQVGLRLGGNFLVYAMPRVSAGPGSIDSIGAYADAKASVLTGITTWRNVRLEIGRQHVVWGQGFDGGLMLSASGPPLDMVRVSSEAPFHAPWVFRRFGPLRASAFIADLGSRQDIPHAKLFAYKLSAQILPWFELSPFVMGEQGGRGAPVAPFIDYVVDLIPPLKYSLRHKNRSQFSNKMAGGEGRIRVPSLHGLQIYGDVTLDDADPRRWRSTFVEDGGQSFGISIQDLGPQGALSAATEYHHTGIRYFKHTVFSSGFAFNQTVLGDQLGNQGDGGYLRLRWDGGGRRALTLDLASERRRGDQWGTTSTPPDEDDFRFVLQQSFPAEWRRRASLEWLTWGSGRRLALTVAFERVTNFEFVRDQTLNNLLIGASFHADR